jgi:hypothetical protein
MFKISPEYRVKYCKTDCVGRAYYGHCGKNITRKQSLSVKQTVWGGHIMAIMAKISPEYRVYQCNKDCGYY